jgi:hypothetical protein
VLDAILVWNGFLNWPELTLLSMGMMGLIWALSILSPFSTRIFLEENSFTRAGILLRLLAALLAPVIAAVVVNIPFINYRQGAAILAALLGVSAIMFTLGKSMDIKALLANLAIWMTVTIAVNVMPVPPRSAPPTKFEHNIETDVNLKINLQTYENRSQKPSILYTCYAILPDTWFTARPRLYLTIASNVIKSEAEVSLPYSPLGYVIEAIQDGESIGKPGLAEVEVRDVYPGESRRVIIKVLKKN